MSGRLDPAVLVNHTYWWLNEQPGVVPELRASQIRPAEAAAEELLLCFDVEPVGPGESRPE